MTYIDWCILSLLLSPWIVIRIIIHKDESKVKKARKDYEARQFIV